MGDGNVYRGVPRPQTSFVGRAQEVTEIRGRLATPDCQLLTVVGPGGIGKTRLALQVATQQQAAGEAVSFVALHTLERADLLPLAIAHALGLTLAAGDPAQQVLELLRTEACLLVLDNFEQILTGATWLAALLEAAPALKLLVTSRERLNLRGEWVYPLQGLRMPSEAPGELVDAAALTTFDAPRLFVERAQQVTPHFDAAAPAVLRICTLVDGMPLALELAAAWTRTLPCEAIAEEITRDLHFLATTLRDVPPQHRSMRAVFDRSWALLSAEEQLSFARLAPLHSGFAREAATTIAGATLPILTTLVDKSLLRMDAQGRYHVHPLLRQYGAERLAADPSQAAATRAAHIRYYLTWMTAQDAALVTASQAQAIQDVAAEWENVRAAWIAAVAEMPQWWALVCAAAAPLQNFCDFRGDFREGTTLLEQARAALPTDTAAAQSPHTRLTTLLGWCYLREGRLHEAAANFGAAHADYEQRQAQPPPGFGTDPLPGLAVVTTAQGRYGEAIALAEKAVARLRGRDDVQNLLIAAHIAGDAYLAQGEIAQAAAYSQWANQLALDCGNGWMQGYVLRNLGTIARAQGDYAAARQAYSDCYALKERLDDPEGMAVALVELGRVAQAEEEYAQAAALYRRSETIYRRIHDRGGLVNTLMGMGQCALAQGAWTAAAAHLREALTLATAAGFVPQQLALCLCVLRWQTALHATGVPTRLPAAPFDIAAWVAEHPATEFSVRQSAGHARRDPGQAAPPTEPTVALSAALDWAHATLATPLAAEGFPRRAPTPTVEDAVAAAAANNGLVEPLTPRELEVFTLLAQGLSNQAIADRLIVAVGTVKSYTSQIYSKLGVANRTQALVRGRDLGLL